jgi:hypothetical protein
MEHQIRWYVELLILNTTPFNACSVLIDGWSIDFGRESLENSFSVFSLKIELCLFLDLATVLFLSLKMIVAIVQGFHNDTTLQQQSISSHRHTCTL